MPTSVRGCPQCGSQVWIAWQVDGEGQAIHLNDESFTIIDHLETQTRARYMPGHYITLDECMNCHCTLCF